VVGGDSLPRKKPYPDQIQFVLDRINIPPEQVLMVGDSAQDVQAGKAAGVLTCGIRSNIGDTQQLDASKPEFMLNQIEDLVGILEEIASSETCITKSSKPSA
jgi:phosphoglycolate phosphatase